MVGVRACRKTFRNVDHEAQASAFERRLGEVEGGPDGHGEVEILEPGWRGGGVALGQGIERVRQPDETLGLVEQ
jgi:hypothetical protein